MLQSYIITEDKNDRAIGLWLLVVAFAVFCMVVVGGATRLTESGLSMVHWKPISGIIPPLSDADWQEEFEAYQAYPQFQLVNRSMEVDEFKTIFWWEYAHRLLGRFIGLLFAIPLLYFIAKRKVRTELKMPLFVLLGLGAAQGLLGWYMVQSGLVDEPAVSQYRLAAHLCLALFLLVALVWLALSILRPARRREAHPMLLCSGLFVVAVFIQCFLGALVAGLDAGKIYNSWPLMDGKFVPDYLNELQPYYLNWFENGVAVQFNHRMGAYALAIFAFVLAAKAIALKAKGVSIAAWHVVGAILLQIIIGIYTLIHAVPVALGTLHQAGGAIVLVTAIILHHQLWRLEK